MLALGLLFLLANGEPTFAHPSPRWSQSPVYPKLKSSHLLGDVIDPSLQRDSCGSVRWGDRALWVCRDTEFLIDDSYTLLVNGTFANFTTSTASYTNFKWDGTLDFEPVKATPYLNYTSQLTMYGSNNAESFYAIQADECDQNQAGSCSDGTRFAIWPSVPPTIASEGPDGSIEAFTFIRNEHITDTLGVVTPEPSTSLYKLTYSPSVEGEGDTLPNVQIVTERFWQENQFAYGDYGTVVHNGWAYLYAQNSKQDVALAKVPVTSYDDQSQFQFWVNGSWSKEVPSSINDTAAYLTNAGAGGQGTYFWSDAWNCFVWLGGPALFPVPTLYVSTAPEPQGPWIEPYAILNVVGGNYTLPAYSFQAHPGLVSNPWSKEMYISYTKVDGYGSTDFGIYSQPVYFLQFD